MLNLNGPKYNKIANKVKSKIYIYHPYSPLKKNGNASGILLDLT